MDVFNKPAVFQGYAMTVARMRLHYPIDYSVDKIPNKYGPLDGDGLPLFDSRILRLSLGYIYHPMVILQYGLAHFELALRGESAAKDTVYRCTKWLEDHAIEEPSKRFLVWYYYFPLKSLPEHPLPWFSGMQQGQALSLLVRAYQNTKSLRTAITAQQAAQSFLYNISEGGVMSRTIQGNGFIEEYAFRPASHVLNGCLYALVGLHDYLTVFPDARLQNVLEQTTRGVIEVLPDYDLGWWSRYSLGLRWNMATPYYHSIHVALLRYLGEVLPSEVLERYANHWEHCQRESSNLRKRWVLGIFEKNANRALRLLNLKRLRNTHAASFK
jgi:heparosan-N-sulfate-glucuronate 5-epimerase